MIYMFACTLLDCILVLGLDTLNGNCKCASFIIDQGCRNLNALLKVKYIAAIIVAAV